jgi:cytochrome c-type biogenesis protein CcmF
MTSGQIGDLTLVITFAMTIMAGISFLITAIGRKNLFSLGVRAYYLQTTFVTVALGYLLVLFFKHDFSIKYIVEYSSSDLPFFYLLSALWGGQEGTYLFWLFLSTVLGLFILKKARQYTSWGMFFHSLIQIFLLSIMVFALSPFRSLASPPAEGAGLNPLLQDPWMVVHPPVMFVAFALAGIPFALALAALVKRDFSEWLKITLPYVLVTSFMLIVANVLGGYWAYKTLGWGGYWAWDPVENTSFIPWVVSLGLVHGMLIERRSGSLRQTNLLGSAFLFLLIIYGTFLTRSGVLSDFSVHSFVDLGTNGMLAGFLIGFLLLTLAIFFTSRSPEKAGKPLNYNIFSRDFILFIGMNLLLILGIIVLFWSSLPLITRYLSAKPAAADIATYNSFALPISIIISLFLTLSPILTGLGFKVNNLKTKSLLAGLVALLLAVILLIIKVLSPTLAITTFVYFGVLLIYLQNRLIQKPLVQALAIGLLGAVMAILFGASSMEHILFIGAATAAVGAQLIALIAYIPKRMELIGAHLSHFGTGFMLVGILASSAFSTSEQITIPRGQQKSAFDYYITYKGIAGTLNDNNNEILLTMKDGDREIDAHPRFFFSERMDGMMKKPYIHIGLFYDLYLSPQDIQETPGGDGLVLHKGESATVGDYKIKFINYDMSAHQSSGGMSVGAQLEVEYKGAKETITPRMVANSNPGAGPNMIGEPTPIFSGQSQNIELARVFASEGAVALTIPGLVEPGSPDKLILDVSMKPGINLLWFGTIIIFVGMAMAGYYRINK